MRRAVAALLVLVAACGAAAAFTVTGPMAGAAGTGHRAPSTGSARHHGHRLSIVAAAIVPPKNPAKSLPPDPNFREDGACAAGELDDSLICNTNAETAIDNARQLLEALKPLVLNLGAFAKMTVPQQMFVIVDLERVDRGLAPIAGMTGQLDADARVGATGDTDPSLSMTTLKGGATITSDGANWASGTNNPLGSDYYWMYDDGYHSFNGDCPTRTSSGCWGHRDNILGTYASAPTCAAYSLGKPEAYMGAAATASGSVDGPSFAEILVGACGPTPTDVTFTWSHALKALG